MKVRGRIGQVIMLGSTLGVLVIAGCIQPEDRWLFEHDYREQFKTFAERKIDVPAEVKPQSKQTFDIETPADGSPLKLSIEQATMLAIARNRDLRVQQLNPVIAGTFELIERGQFDPELYARLSYTHEVASETSRSTGDQFDVKADETDGEVGVRQRLPSGTEVAASIGHEWSNSNRAPEQQKARLGLSVTQSLLRGFGPAVNLARVEQAKLEAVASRYELTGFVEALLAQTEIAYWRYVLSVQEIAIFEKSLEVAREQLKQLEEQVSVGTLPKADLAPARAQIALRQQGLINARSFAADRRLRLLRLLNVGDREEMDLGIEATSKPQVAAQPIKDAAERIKLALQVRPDLKEAELRLQQDRLEVIVTRDGLQPRLDLFVDLGLTGFSKHLGGSFGNISDGETYDVTAGIVYSRTLGNRAAEARDFAARATREQSAQAIANLKQQVRLEVRLAINEVERARQQITATAAVRQSQQATADAEEAKRRAGTGTALLVAQAQRDLLEAQIAEVEAVVNYRIALVNLYLVEGSLLDRRGVALPGAKAPRASH